MPANKAVLQHVAAPYTFPHQLLFLHSQHTHLDETLRDGRLPQGSTHECTQGSATVAVLTSHVGVGEHRLLKRICVDMHSIQQQVPEKDNCWCNQCLVKPPFVRTSQAAFETGL